jgi:hypothetical protein
MVIAGRVDALGTPYQSMSGHFELPGTGRPTILVTERCRFPIASERA